jgi:hypothetical protein
MGDADAWESGKITAGLQGQPQMETGFVWYRLHLTVYGHAAKGGHARRASY